MDAGGWSPRITSPAATRPGIRAGSAREAAWTGTPLAGSVACSSRRADVRCACPWNEPAGRAARDQRIPTRRAILRRWNAIDDSQRTPRTHQYTVLQRKPAIATTEPRQLHPKIAARPASVPLSSTGRRFAVDKLGSHADPARPCRDDSRRTPRHASAIGYFEASLLARVVVPPPPPHAGHSASDAARAGTPFTRASACRCRIELNPRAHACRARRKHRSHPSVSTLRPAGWCPGTCEAAATTSPSRPGTAARVPAATLRRPAHLSTPSTLVAIRVLGAAARVDRARPFRSRARVEGLRRPRLRPHPERARRSRRPGTPWRSRALVEAVEHAVAVDVLGTAHLVHGAARGRVRTLVDAVEHAVAVRVLGAAFLVHERAAGGARTIVLPVDHTVAVGIGRRTAAEAEQHAGRGFDFPCGLSTAPSQKNG